MTDKLDVSSMVESDFNVVFSALNKGVANKIFHVKAKWRKDIDTKSLAKQIDPKTHKTVPWITLQNVKSEDQTVVDQVKTAVKNQFNKTKKQAKK